MNADIIGDGSSLSTASATLAPDSSAASITYLWQRKGVSDASWINIQDGGVDVTTTNLVSTVLLTFSENTSIRRVASVSYTHLTLPTKA